MISDIYKMDTWTHKFKQNTFHRLASPQNRPLLFEDQSVINNLCLIWSNLKTVDISFFCSLFLFDFDFFLLVLKFCVLILHAIFTLYPCPPPTLVCNFPFNHFYLLQNDEAVTLISIIYLSVSYLHILKSSSYASFSYINKLDAAFDQWKWALYVSCTLTFFFQ